MALFGWLVCLLVLLFVLFLWVIAAITSFGPYNIGGVKNTFTSKVNVVIAGGALWLMFTWLFAAAPFTFSLR